MADVIEVIPFSEFDAKSVEPGDIFWFESSLGSRPRYGKTSEGEIVQVDRVNPAGLAVFIRRAKANAK